MWRLKFFFVNRPSQQQPSQKTMGRILHLHEWQKTERQIVAKKQENHVAFYWTIHALPTLIKRAPPEPSTHLYRTERGVSGRQHGSEHLGPKLLPCTGSQKGGLDAGITRPPFARFEPKCSLPCSASSLPAPPPATLSFASFLPFFRCKFASP